MNKTLRYFLIFGTITVLLVLISINTVEQTNNTHGIDNPDSYTINSSTIRTNNGHVLKCTYKEDKQFVYNVGCVEDRTP